MTWLIDLQYVRRGLARCLQAGSQWRLWIKVAWWIVYRLVICARAGSRDAGAGVKRVLLVRGRCIVAPNHYSRRTALWADKSLPRMDFGSYAMPRSNHPRLWILRCPMQEICNTYMCYVYILSPLKALNNISRARKFNTAPSTAWLCRSPKKISTVLQPAIQLCYVRFITLHKIK